MLGELYRYAIEHHLAAQPGFKPKRNVKAHVQLAADGSFLGLSLRDKNAPPVYAPDFGSLAASPHYCNPLIEKAKIPLHIIQDPEKDRSIPERNGFFLMMLDDGTADEAMFGVVAKALRNADTVAAIVAALDENKIKPSDMIGFMVDGVCLEDGAGYPAWWQVFRASYSELAEGNLPRCMITGELRPAMATVPKVPGLISVGGHTAGDAFLCFDKQAFQSYGFEKSFNAPVSEEAMVAVNAALTDLIAKAPRPFGKAKLLHWYADGEVFPDEDLISLALEGEWASADDSLEEAFDNREADALGEADKTVMSIQKGVRPESLKARYYLMSLSGANGRMMVRNWLTGSYEELYRSVMQWFDDLSLVSWNGKGMARNPKMKALGVRLLKPGGDPRKVWERMDSEIPQLMHRLLSSAVNNTPLPDEVPMRVLHWLRSTLLMSDNNESKTANFAYETLAFQLLKAWLCRKQRMRGDTNIMEAVPYPEEVRCVAYHCGQLMAIYSGIQQEAYPNMGKGTAERFFTSASTRPAMTLGKLAQQAQHHLAKLEPKFARRYERLISDAMMRIGDRAVPACTTVEEQTEFALGYYQQRATLYAPRESDK